MKVFLGDLVHTWEKVGVWTMPLNIGFIGSYAQANVRKIDRVQLFKRPERLIDAIKESPPDVIGLSFYVWNTHLNSRIADIAKEVNPDILVVGGGPQFTTLNATDERAKTFFSAHPNIDAYVVNQGERGFVELLSRYIESGNDLPALRAMTVDGCLINQDGEGGKVSVGQPLDPIRDLDEIPSPYLSGMLDEFFEEPFNPMIETNRSCPYRCTFCAWGIGTQKLSRFGDDRVRQEIDYIAQRCKNATILHVCDANFAILERDAEFAESMYHSHVETGFPGRVALQWNKTRSDRTARVAKAFNGIAEIGASMQSFNPKTLAQIERRNLPLEDVVNMIESVNNDSGSSAQFSELILGLPEETWDTHVEANKKLMDLGFEVHNYNLHLLPGTEMEKDESRARNFEITGWRLHDNAFGVYDGKPVFEGQEVVLQTKTMSREEISAFRHVHWLTQMMWGRRYYIDFLQLLWKQGVHPFDMVIEICRQMRVHKGVLGQIYEEFSRDYALEDFETEQALFDYWSKEENLMRLRGGDYGKLNAVYTHKINLQYNEEFNDFLVSVADKVLPHGNTQERRDTLELCRELNRFNFERRVALTKALSLVTSKEVSFGCDILSWRRGNYSSDQPVTKPGTRYAYEFYLPRQQKNDLETKLTQFRSHNLNLTWRKMTEYSNPDQFFYEVRPLSAPSSQG